MPIGGETTDKLGAIGVRVGRTDDGMVSERVLGIDNGAGVLPKEMRFDCGGRGMRVQGGETE